MHVIFIAPHFPTYQKRFVLALKAVGAHISGIGDSSEHELPNDVREALDSYYQISNVTDTNALTECVKYIQGLGWVDRLEATIESHMLAAALTREACNIPGMNYQQTLICRDKTTMKQFLRDRGIPCAAFNAIDNPEEIKAFADDVGYPIIIKPRDGAGASATFRCNNPQDLWPAVQATGADKGQSVAVEEFLEGHEGFYDTLTANGQVQYEFVSHYFPNVLEAMRTRWISPYIIVTNRSDLPDYNDLKALGRKVIEEIGLGTVPTHMEWFATQRGLKFSEIGARPPGVGQWDLYCAANEIDLYKEWANAIVHGQCYDLPTQRYSAAILNLRPTQDGTILGYSGVDEVMLKYSEWIISCHFPDPGTPTQPIANGYMANAWIQMKYPDYDELRSILMEIANTITVHAG